MVVTLDYSTMNVEQIAQAMKLNNLSLDSAKIFIAMIPHWQDAENQKRAHRKRQ